MLTVAVVFQQITFFKTSIEIAVDYIIITIWQLRDSNKSI